MGGKEAGSITLGQYLRQLARHRNFLWFVGMDLVQVWERCPLPGWLGNDSFKGTGSSEAGKSVLASSEDCWVLRWQEHKLGS